MFQKIQVLIILIIIPLAGMYMYFEKNNISITGILSGGVPIIHIGDIPIRVEIVNSDEERTRGLSGRSALGEVEGMLFVFPKSDRYGFWMKDMKFAIDIIWIDENLTVIDINQNITPETYPRTFRSGRPTRYVVETNANYTETFGIRVGDKVVLPAELGS